MVPNKEANRVENLNRHGRRHPNQAAADARAIAAGDQRVFSPEGLAEYLGVPLKTVYRWNSEGTGPRVRRVGRHCRYLGPDVDEWLEQAAS